MLGVLLVFAAVALLIRATRSPADRAHLYPIPEGEDRILAEVLNGAGAQGLARTGTRTLRRHGVDVVFFGTADSAADSTRLLVRRGSRERAEEVKKLLGAGRIELAPDSTRRVDVTVILGKDWTPPVELHP